MAEDKLVKKQPVVVLVGHIDHGKTSILDYIRKAHVGEKETGGITQHIGAYEVEEKGQKITFIDTPGHEAFSAMRARGAKVADIAILVVAGDEGVKPQTKEAISHIKKAQIPMIVAVNKIDKPQAKPERVKDELSKEDMVVEERGGKIPCVGVSAKTGKGIAQLLEIILLVAEMEDFKTELSGEATGVVIESLLDSKRGVTATLILEKGAMKEGDFVGTASCFGKIKRMENFQGEKIEKVLPGQPVLVLGFEKIPVMGEEFRVFQNLEMAKANIKQKEQKEPLLNPVLPEQKIFNLILKTDVLGSIEAIETVLAGLSQEKVFLRILKAEVGAVNLSDIKLAETSRAAILGFRTKIPSQILEMAKRKNIKVLNFDLIYDLVEGTRFLMEKILIPEKIRVELGRLRVLIIFRSEKRRQIVGARVLQGEIRQGCKIEVFRPSFADKKGEEVNEEQRIGKGKVVGLEKDKKEIGIGTKGEEVGILYEGEEKIQEDDILVAYEETKQRAEL